MLFILILISSLLLQFFLPWWVIGPVAFIFAAWKARSGGHAFIAGFEAIFLLWLIMSLIKTLPNDNILANRVGQMLGLPDYSYAWLIVLMITGIIGGFAGAFSAMAGFYCRQAVSK
jgi:hypothetical protein